MTRRAEALAPAAPVLRPCDVAERWQCSEQFVRNLEKKGELQGFRPGGRMLRFTLLEIQKYEASGKAPEPMTAYDRWKATRGQGQSQRRA